MIKAINELPYNQINNGVLFSLKNAIKSKKTARIRESNYGRSYLNELNISQQRKNYPRRKIVVNHIDEIFAVLILVEMSKYLLN